MQRREFIKKVSLTTAIGANLKFNNIPVWISNNQTFKSVEDDDTILVVIQLFGGNDGLNTIIPADDDRYYSKLRPTLNIPKNKSLRLGNSLSYMNPILGNGLNQGLYGLFNEGKLTVIQGIGYPVPSLSHFRSTDILLSGITPENDTQRIESGWLARKLMKEDANKFQNYPPCMNIGTAVSMIFQHGSNSLAVLVDDPNAAYERGKDLLSGGEPLLEGQSYFASEHNFLVELGLKCSKYSGVVKKAFDMGKNNATYEDNKLSSELKLIARLISGGLKTQMYSVSMETFDTHANQGTTDGAHAYLLNILSTAVASFMADLKVQSISKKVVGITISEFGRRPEQNASIGTDHGAASVMFMFGESVNGKVFGNNLSIDHLDENKNFAIQYDYRQIYDELMDKWFKTPANITTDVLKKRFSHIEGGILK